MQVVEPGERIKRRLSEPQYRAFLLARHAARRVIDRRLRLLRLGRQASSKLLRDQHALKRVATDLNVLLRLSRAWARNEYREIPWKTVFYVVAALIYFVNPIDLVPDAIAGLGYIDDLAVITAVVRSIRSDLDRYRAWESKLLLADPSVT